MSDADELRAEMLDAWDRQAGGWGRQADRLREDGMPVSLRMVELAGLKAGDQILELAAGPGDTGFLAAPLISPGGMLICSDASEPMLGVARERAAEQGVDNVEFRQLQLEWIDLPTASADAILCRWGVMLCLDPAAALTECRRVLRPDGRISVAVWDLPDANPWATIPNGTLVSLGLATPPATDEAGPFALSAPGALAELLAGAGFLDVVVEPIEIGRRFTSILDLVGQMIDCSGMFSRVWRELGDERRRQVREELEARTREFAGAGGEIILPGRSLIGAGLA
jgi:SAM-dependent methyltransferase